MKISSRRPLKALILVPLIFTGFVAHAFEPVQPNQPTILRMDTAADDYIIDIDCPYEVEEPPESFDIEFLQSTSRGDCDDYEIPPVSVSTDATDKLVKALTDADRTCDEMLLARPQDGIDLDLYRIDCYRLMYRKLADSMPTTGDYAPIRRALLTASDKLNQIVRANLDSEAPKVRVRERAKPAAPATDTLRAIRPDRAEEATAQAAAVLEETAIVILRSGEIPTRRNIHYTRVSAAVEENIAVLRSA